MFTELFLFVCGCLSVCLSVCLPIYHATVSNKMTFDTPTLNGHKSREEPLVGDCNLAREVELLCMQFMSWYVIVTH